MPLGSDLEKQKEIHPFRCLGYHGETGANKKSSATERASRCSPRRRATTRSCHSGQRAPGRARAFQWQAPAWPCTSLKRLQPPLLAPRGQGTGGTALQLLTTTTDKPGAKSSALATFRADTRRADSSPNTPGAALIPGGAGLRAFRRGPAAADLGMKGGCSAEPETQLGGSTTTKPSMAGQKLNRNSAVFLSQMFHEL